MSPAELALLGYVEIPFDILDMIDRPFERGSDPKILARESLSNLDSKYTTGFLIEKLKMF